MRRDSAFKSTRPLDYVYDRVWTAPHNVFAQDAAKAMRSLSKIVVRPDFKTMFSARTRHSVSIIPDRAAPYGMQAYRRFQWMKKSSGNRQVDVAGRDSHRFRTRSCPRAVTDTQEAEALVSTAVRSNWRSVRFSPLPIKPHHHKEGNRKIVISDKLPSQIHHQDRSEYGGRIHSERNSEDFMSLGNETLQSGDEISVLSHHAITYPTGRLSKENRFRIRGLSPSEERLIILNRQERHLVREAWESTLPKVDTTLVDYERRAAVAVEFEKDKWNLRLKEIEAINRARYLNEERDRNRKTALLADFHLSWIEQRTKARALQIRPYLRKIRRNHKRAVKKLEDCIGENWASSKFDLKPAKKSEPLQLCVYMTKWTSAKLRNLHEDLKAIRKESTRARCRFKPRERALQSDTTENDSDNGGPHFVPLQEEKVFHAILTLQKILRGRAVQTLMYKGRRHNRELIREILSSKPFDTGEEEPNVATQGLNASTGWPRLKTYDEYSQRPPQEKWVLQTLWNLPQSLSPYNLEDFINMNLMKMRGRHTDKSVDNTETAVTSVQTSAKSSKDALDGGYISCAISRTGKKRSVTPKRRLPNETRDLMEGPDLGRFIARMRPRHVHQESPVETTTHSDETTEQPYAGSLSTSQGTVIHVGRVETQTAHETPPILQSVNFPTAANVNASAAPRLSTSANSSLQDLRGNQSQISTVEIHGRSSSHVGFRNGPWTCRSPQTDCPGTPASEDTVTAISRFTGDDFLERRLDEEELEQRPSAGFNVSASASEETPSTDDTHIITDDATEQLAAAFRAKVREQGNTLAAQRIDEAPSPTDSQNSSTLAIPLLGRSVSQQRAPTDVACSVSEEHARRIIAQATNSTTSITTDDSESSWTLNEARSFGINRHMHGKNRNRIVKGKMKTTFAESRTTGGEKKESSAECDKKIMK